MSLSQNLLVLIKKTKRVLYIIGPKLNLTIILILSHALTIYFHDSMDTGVIDS